MQFLYFLKDAPAQVNLAEWGLSHVGTKSSAITARQVQAPHMGNGLLVTRGDADICRVDPSGDNQRWHKMPTKFTGGKDIWCGWWLDKVPSAETLARKQQLPGVEVALVGGEKWLVPTLRKFVESDRPWPVYNVSLPTILEYDTDGNLTIGAVIPEYRDLWSRALQVADYVVEGNGQLNATEAIEFAGQVLRLNYHVSMFEVVTLGLMTEQNALDVVWKSLDMLGWRDRIKNLVSRLQSSGTNSANGGEPDSAEKATEPTDPQLQT
jgi:hypothetical protein